jgi:hypothetical protein
VVSALVVVLFKFMHQFSRLGISTTIHDIHAKMMSLRFSDSLS